MPAPLDLRRGQVVGDASRRAINLNTVSRAAAAATYAPIASPTFTGDPKAPTPAPGDNDTSVATTAFVHNAVAAAVPVPLTIPLGGTNATTAPAALTGLGAMPAAGVTNASNATAGNVGEFISAATGAVAQTNGTITNLTQVSLTAGDWDVMGAIDYNASGAVLTDAYCCVSTAAGDVNQTNMLTAPWIHMTGPAHSRYGVAPPRLRVNVSTTTTVYLVAFCLFATGTVNAIGALSARRRR